LDAERSVTAAANFSAELDEAEEAIAARPHDIGDLAHRPRVSASIRQTTDTEGKS
jgi:hypothetical protein